MPVITPQPKEIPIQGGNVSIICSQFKGIYLLRYPSGLGREFTERMPLWVISGKERTGENGKCLLYMNQYLTYPIPCIHKFTDSITDEAIIDKNPRFIASPECDMPAVLTTKVISREIDYGCYLHDLITGEGFSIIKRNATKTYDVQVEVTSWKLDGTVAPRTSFSWIFIAAGCLVGERPV